MQLEIMEMQEENKTFFIATYVGIVLPTNQGALLGVLP